jgi:hypothetical protein
MINNGDSYESLFLLSFAQLRCLETQRLKEREKLLKERLANFFVLLLTTEYTN